MARPSSFNQDTANIICDRLSDGESLRKICLDEEMPCQATVFNWLANPEYRAFLEQYAHAREQQADKLAEDILEIADEEVTMIKRSKHDSKADAESDEEIEVVFDPTAVARNRLRVDARKWLASKMAPKKYGDKVAIGGADDLPPVQTVTKVELVALRANDSGTNSTS